MILHTLQVMDLTSLRAVVSELSDELLPSRFEKAQQPSSQTLQLGFRTLSGLIWLEICWGAEAARLVRIPPPSRLGTGSTLAQQMQHCLRQMALISIDQAGFERVVQLGFASRPGEELQRCLVLELMGRHSNLLLLDQQRKVIAIGRQVRNHQSRVRPISTGDIYGEPPTMPGIAPSSKESLERWRERLCLVPNTVKKALQSAYQGISPALALQLAGDNQAESQLLLASSVRELNEGQWQDLHKRWLDWLNHLENDQFVLSFDGPTAYRVWGQSNYQETKPYKELGLALGFYYRQELCRKEFKRLDNELQQRLGNWRRKEEMALMDQQQRLDASLQSSSYQNKADAILCLPSPSKEQIDEAQKFYKTARKLRRATPAIQQRINHHKLRIQMIQGSESFLDNLRSAGWDTHESLLNRLEELRKELDEFLAPTRLQQRINRDNSNQRPQPLQISTPGGLILQIGRNHRQNDWISLRQAQQGDLWFHAQECPGSHVVLKTGDTRADDEDIHLAADMAAHFSRARGNHHVPVVMVPAHHLQRIPGSIPGTVHYRGGEILWAQPDRGLQYLCSCSINPLA